MRDYRKNSWRPIGGHISLFLILSLLALEVGCFTAQGWQEGECETREDCRDWQVCREGVCLKDPSIRSCDILARDCGVGQTCIRDAEYAFSYCQARPLRIGFASLESANGSMLPSVTSDYFEYLLNETSMRTHFERGTAWSFELIEYTYPNDPTQEALVSVVEEMMRDDLDIILTTTSSRYAVTTAKSDNTLVLGVYNRRADVVLEELERAKSEGYPDHDQRHDFSIAPLQHNDQATMAHFVATNNLCKNLVVPYEVDSDTARLRALLVQGEAPRHEICGVPHVVENIEDGEEISSRALADLAELDRPENCILWTLGELPLLAAYARRLEESGEQPQATALVALSAVSESTAKLYPELFTPQWRERSVLLSFGLSKDDLSSFEAELYVESRYRAVYEQHCQGDALLQAPCLDGSSFDHRSTDGLLDSPFSLNYRRDLLTMAVLSAYRARTRHGEGFDQEQLRDSFLSIIEHAPDHTACDRETLDSCFERLLQQREIRFDGSSSPMILGEDGRMLSLYETMRFDRLDGGAGVEIDLDERIEYSGKQMLANHQAPLVEDLVCPAP